MCRGERAFFSYVFRGPYHLLCRSSREVKTETMTMTKTKTKKNTKTRQNQAQDQDQDKEKDPRQDKTKSKTLLHGGGFSSFFPGGWGKYKLGCPSFFNIPTTPLKKNLNKCVSGGARAFFSSCSGATTIIMLWRHVFIKTSSQSLSPT